MSRPRSGGQEWLLHLLPPAQYKEEHPLRGLIADAVEALPDDDRLTLEAWAWEEIPLIEIARRLGLNARQSAHYRVQRALGLLKDELKERGFEL